MFCCFENRRARMQAPELPTRRRWRAPAALALVALLAAACDKTPLFAPSSATISLNAVARVLPTGGSTELTAFVLESGGTPVQNGTTVRFTSTLGRVEPVEAQTRNGMAVVTFFAGDSSGVAEVRAVSGAAGGGTAPSTGTGGTTTTTASNVVQITIGAAAASRISLVASPASVPSSGGTSQITATVLDASGNALPGAPVQFSTTAGTLSQSSATTDASGNATVTLTTNREADVTARVGAGTEARSATVKVTVNITGTATLQCTGSSGTAGNSCSQVVGSPVTFTAARSTTTGAAAITSATLDFGDGTSTNLGNLAATAAVTHTYQNPGNYTATLRTVDANGEVATASAVATITPRPPINVNVTATQTGGAMSRAFSFTANVTPAAAVDTIESYEWNFDDGTSVTTSGNTTSHVYTAAGTFVVTVTVRTTDGRTASGRTEIVVP